MWNASALLHTVTKATSPSGFRLPDHLGCGYGAGRARGQRGALCTPHLPLSASPARPLPSREASQAAWLAQEQRLAWGHTSAQRRVLAALQELKASGRVMGAGRESEGRLLA